VTVSQFENARMAALSRFVETIPSDFTFYERRPYYGGHLKIARLPAGCIEEVMRGQGGSKRRAAEALGCKPRALSMRLNALGIAWKWDMRKK
jgi:hypothetical protein